MVANPLIKEKTIYLGFYLLWHDASFPKNSFPLDDEGFLKVPYRQELCFKWEMMDKDYLDAIPTILPYKDYLDAYPNNPTLY